MAEDLIRYDVLVQEAMRTVVRKVLNETARAGLPGNHHFFIAFDTRAPGVRISSRLRERYPEEMTVVLQHQFWNLIVTDASFEVGLSFGGTPERLFIPFSAVKGFFDPSVDFGLQFEVLRDEGEGAAPGDTAPAEADGASATAGDAPAAPTPLRPAPNPASNPAAAEPEAAGAPAAAAADTEAPGPAEPARKGDVVSLDAFRKKT